MVMRRGIPRPRTILVIVALAIPLIIWLTKTRIDYQHQLQANWERQDIADRKIRALGGRIGPYNGKNIPLFRPHLPTRIGLTDPVHVWLLGPPHDEWKGGDDDLALLQDVANLHRLRIQATINVTDAGLKHLAQLRSLKQLELLGTGITESGAQWLRDQLPPTVEIGFSAEPPPQ